MVAKKSKSGGKSNLRPRKKKTIAETIKEVLEVASAVNTSVDLAITIYNKIPDEVKDFILNSVTLNQFSQLTVALAHVEFRKPLNRSVVKKMMASEPGRRLFVELLENYISYLNHRKEEFEPNVHVFIAQELMRLKIEMKYLP